MSQSAHIAFRVTSENPNHHLWNNNGTWWCHFTLHQSDFTKWRVRRSTGTRQIGDARAVRDFLIAVLPHQQNA